VYSRRACELFLSSFQTDMTYVVGAEIVNLVNIYCACSLDEITGSFLNTLFLVEENFVFHLFLFCPIFEDSKFHVLGLNFV